MQHEYREGEGLRETARRRSDSDKAADGPGSDLGAQIGNQALGKLVQRSATKSQGAGPLDPEIGEEIQSAKGGGQALDESTQADMEGHLGVDLSGVRVHTDSNADHLNRSVQAEAFTTGSDVFFKSGKYNPSSSDGRRLLAHELTHVVQQSSGEVGGESRVSHPDDAHEVEAKSVGDAVASSAPSGTVDRHEELDGESGAIDRADDEEAVEDPMQLSIDREEDEEEATQFSLDRQEDGDEMEDEG